MFRFYRRFLTDRQVEKRYANSGCVFGDAVSYLAFGECEGFESMLQKWANWEREYANRGYRTLPIDDFIAAGGYGKELIAIGTKRLPGEQAVFHAEIYRTKFLGKIPPQVDISATLNGEIQMGHYVVPSSKIDHSTN